MHYQSFFFHIVIATLIFSLLLPIKLSLSQLFSKFDDLLCFIFFYRFLFRFMYFCIASDLVNTVPTIEIVIVVFLAFKNDIFFADCRYKTKSTKLLFLGPNVQLLEPFHTKSHLQNHLQICIFLL